MAKIAATIPDPVLRERLENLLKALARDNPIALARVHTDAFRLYSGATRGRHIIRDRSKRVDLTVGQKKLASLKKHAQKLADALDGLPPNLSSAWPECDSAGDARFVREIIERADLANANFQPNKRDAPHDWDALYVDSWASKVYMAYTGSPKASVTHNPTESKLEGRYFTFLTEVFAALGVDANAHHVIRARQKRDAANKKPPA